jgi:amino acid transporter
MTAPDQTLKRFATWRSAFVISLGGSLLVAVLLGPLAKELGPASVVVATVGAIVGVLQCLIIGELAAMFPHKSGGTSTYAHEAFQHISPLFGALSNWGYWFGWIPVVPVNLILAASYIRAAFLPGSSVMTMTFILVILLYVVNAFGLKVGVWSSIVMAACSVVPLMIIALSPIVDRSLFHWSNLQPFQPLHGSWTSVSSLMLMAKMIFLAVWSAYAFESVSTIAAEMEDPARDMGKAVWSASAVGALAYCVVPFMLLGIVGTETLAQDPAVAFLPGARAVFGSVGEQIVAIMLVAALFLGAQTAVVGSSRALYEMSRDGLTITQFGRLNKYGVPSNTAAWNLLITIGMLLLFGDDVVNQVIASNFGYLVPFMLVIPAFVLLRRRNPEMLRPFRLPNAFVPIAVVITVFNWLIFFVGGLQWGLKEMVTGVAVVLTFLPFFLVRRFSQDRRSGMNRVASPESLSPLP